MTIRTESKRNSSYPSSFSKPREGRIPLRNLEKEEKCTGFWNLCHKEPRKCDTISQGRGGRPGLDMVLWSEVVKKNRLMVGRRVQRGKAASCRRWMLETVWFEWMGTKGGHRKWAAVSQQRHCGWCCSSWGRCTWTQEAISGRPGSDDVSEGIIPATVFIIVQTVIVGFVNMISEAEQKGCFLFNKRIDSVHLSIRQDSNKTWKLHKLLSSNLKGRVPHIPSGAAIKNQTPLSLTFQGLDFFSCIVFDWVHSECWQALGSTAAASRTGSRQTFRNGKWLYLFKKNQTNRKKRQNGSQEQTGILL